MQQNFMVLQFSDFQGPKRCICRGWPSGLRHYIHNQKVPGSNPLGTCLGIGIQPHYEDPSDLGVKIGKTLWLNIGLMRLSPREWPMLAVGQPNSS